MTPYQFLVDWETATEPPARGLPFGLFAERLNTRATLISEEAAETVEALNDMQATPGKLLVLREALLKELCDLQYVLSGTLVALGIPEDVFNEAFARVHASNMSKRDDSGNFIFRADGKVLKSKNYKPADLSDLANEF